MHMAIYYKLQVVQSINTASIDIYGVLLYLCMPQSYGGISPRNTVSGEKYLMGRLCSSYNM